MVPSMYAMDRFAQRSAAEREIPVSNLASRLLQIPLILHNHFSRVGQEFQVHRFLTAVLVWG